ncbi:MAG: hypothetical protein RBT11_13375 [Desulfobacterales bacterium]|jgi:chromosome segregation ATPase|nr:hypothetical protein [Desulfobacterales bacterium]
MTERTPPDYHMSLDDEQPESIFTKKPARPPRPKTDRSGRVFPFLVVTLLVVAILAVAVGYMNIRESILSIQNSGTQKAENLSLDLQSKFSSLSLKFSELEDKLTRLNTAFTEKASDISKITTTLQKAVASLQTDIQHTRNALNKAKTDKETSEKKLAALSAELSSINSAIKPLESALKERQAAINAELEKTLAAVSSLQAKTTEISNEIDPLKEDNAALARQLTLLDKRLKQEENRADGAVSQAAVEKLSMQVQALKERLSALEQLQKKQAANRVPATPKSVSPQDQTASPLPTKEPTLPKPGEVIELDIR